MMTGVRLPGGRAVDVVEVPVPAPGSSQVLVRMRASSICGSDVRAIYREHLGHGPEAYQDVIAGHEPCGQVVAVGPDVSTVSVGDRVVIYHIVGCGECAECQRGYPIGCTSPGRQAHGWQRDGGHADYLLTESRACLPLPDSLSYLDGALVSCGVATAYEALLRGSVSGRDDVLITGLGPVGMAAAMLARLLGASPVSGLDANPERVELARSLGLIDAGFNDPDALPPVSVAIDCSGHPAAREAALRSLRPWGRCVFVGEGGSVSFGVSELLIHKQASVHGSWVSSVAHMREVLDLLDRRGEHPERLVTHRFALADAARAYEVADAGIGGKVAIVWDDA